MEPPVGVGHPQSRTLFVGDLGPDVNENALHMAFQQVGIVIRVEVKRDRETGLGLGYGFVELQTHEQAQAAKRAMHSQVLGSRTIRVGWAKKNTNLFVGDLDDSVTDELLRDTFRAYGPLYESESCIKGPSYGFVRFKERGDAEAAKDALQGFVLAGRAIRIGWGDAAVQRHCIYVQYDSTQSIDEHDLEQAFSQYGVVQSVVIPTSHGQQRGYGFVHYAQNDDGEDSTVNAIESLNDTLISGVPIRCTFAKKTTSRTKRRGSHQHSGSHQGGGGGGGSHRRSYGGSSSGNYGRGGNRYGNRHGRYQSHGSGHRRNSHGHGRRQQHRGNSQGSDVSGSPYLGGSPGVPVHHSNGHSMPYTNPYGYAEEGTVVSADGHYMDPSMRHAPFEVYPGQQAAAAAAAAGGVMPGPPFYTVEGHEVGDMGAPGAGGGMRYRDERGHTAAAPMSHPYHPHAHHAVHGHEAYMGGTHYVPMHGAESPQQWAQQMYASGGGGSGDGVFRDDVEGSGDGSGYPGAGPRGYGDPSLPPVHHYSGVDRGGMHGHVVQEPVQYATAPSTNGRPPATSGSPPAPAGGDSTPAPSSAAPSGDGSTVALTDASGDVVGAQDAGVAEGTHASAADAEDAGAQ